MGSGGESEVAEGEGVRSNGVINVQSKFDQTSVDERVI